MTDELLNDHGARLEITEEIFQNHFVVAGAGAGKTSAMIARIVNSVKAGVEIEQILAITFTEAAANEIKVRLRRELTSQLRSADISEGIRERIARALGAINVAPIGTIHSFANSVISRYPLEAKLPIVFSTTDPSTRAAIFDRAIRTYYDGVASDPRRVRLHEIVTRFGFDESNVIDLVEAIDETFISIEDEAGFLDMLEGGLQRFGSLDVDQLLHDAVARLESMSELCTSDDDLLLEAIRGTILPNLRFLMESEIADDEVLKLLAVLGHSQPKRLFGNLSKGMGKASNWGGVASKKQMVDDFNEFLDEFRLEVKSVIDEIVRLFIFDASIAVRTERSLRQSMGKITFSDQIRLCYELLSGANDALLADIAQGYRVILIDEFQDTDPIQVAIFDLLAKASDSTLFFVGDPRQSIYRFRGADPETYLAVASRGHSRISLTSNFRSHSGIVDWVNNLFEENFLKTLPFDLAPMVSARRFKSTHSNAVSVFRPVVASESKRSANQRRSAQAKMVAQTVREYLDKEIEVDGQLRKVRPSDIAVLFPTRSVLGAIRRDLDAVGIPYRSIGGTSIVDEPYIAEVLLFLRAALRPYDQLALVQLLQSESVRVGNDYLKSYLGSSRFAAAISKSRELLQSNGYKATGAVEEALVVLDELKSIITRFSLADGVNFIVRRYSILEKGFRSSGEDFLRHFDTFLGYCRDFDTRGIPAESFVSYIEGIISERQAITEAEGRDVESDAVRLMTIHASKGLEFPIVVVVAAPRGSGRRRSVDIFASSAERMRLCLDLTSSSSFEATLNKQLSTKGVEQIVDLEADSDVAEEIRLFYVASTRAMNQLAVILEEDAPPTKTGPSKSAEMVHHSLFKDGRIPIVDLNPDEIVVREFHLSAAESIDKVDNSFRNKLIENVAELVVRKRRTTASIELGLDEVASEFDVIGDFDSRTNSIAIGIAVHEVLSRYINDSTFDLRRDTPVQLEILEGKEMRERANTAIEQIVAWLDEVGIKDLDRRALSEFSFSVQLDGVLHEGVIDLAFMDGADLQIVDYKVIGSSNAPYLERAIAHYRVQADFYLRSLAGIYPDVQILPPIFLFSTPKELRVQRYGV